MKERKEGCGAVALVAWFRKNMRPMPWRKKPEPYGCWLSEIMMQQTTYEQALPYYERFLKRFPSAGTLAAADEQDVLKAWEGLGYYARARNLLAAAKRIVADGWPTTRDGWLALPGIGPYTASALASVLNDERTCVVDGNVARVFARYWHLKDDFKQQASRTKLAERLVKFMGPSVKSGDFNQAMMELGALVCTPTSPKCGMCPLAASCAARKAGDQEAYPKNAKRGPVPVRKRAFVIVEDGDGNVLMVKNGEGGLLKGLWELPSVEAGADYQQTFSHFKLEAAVWRTAKGAVPKFVNPKKVPLTTAAKRILASADGAVHRV